ncbi:MmgE/PrpD family protein [Shimia sp. R10_1]|uniref:MmgE/PrpD family protein n=1 Tax=Shimia sp. R10_1 TaxID=2821095 RepID=UPI001ADBD429|nr:MmgE/PrpD family protein [Shimia sp. R10_1]MBO9475435.1 MmgE/PrpD family protein [Shimia sp. R10_1]
MNTVLERVADWCISYQATERQRALAADAITDTVACMYLGRDDPATLSVRQAYLSGSIKTGPARLIGGGRTDATIAAAVNGTAAHALDFDDNFRPALSHASAVSVPALLATANEFNSSGAQVVEAYLVALQVQGLIGAGVVPSHYTAGWHSTSTIGAIGTAAGVAHLMKFERSQIVSAMSLAVSFASGSKAQFGAPVKPFHAGLGAKNAIEAARLAQAGLYGHADIIERKQGFLELFGGNDPRGYADINITPSVPHYIETAGVMPKRFACCGSSHMAIDMALDLRDEGLIKPDNIVELSVKVRIANYRNMPFTHPKNEMEARFSMSYCIARAVRSGRLSVADFTPDSVARYAGEPLLDRIKMTHYTPEEEAAEDFLPHILTATLMDGSKVERVRRDPKGSISEPFTGIEKREKFLDCLKEHDGKTELFERLQSINSSDTLEALTPLFECIE